MKRRIFIYICLLAALVVTEIYVNNLYSLLLLVLAVFLPIESFVFCAFSAKKLSLEISAEDVIYGGDDTGITLEFSNDSIFSVATAMVDLSIVNFLTGETIEKTLKASVPEKGKENLTVSLEGCGVGRIFVTVAKLYVYDVFGTSRFAVKTISECDILVMPNDEHVELIMPDAIETQGESVRFSEHRSGNDPTEIFDIREYVSGDDVRRIHWKLTGKWDRPILKELSQPLNYSIVLIVELCEESARDIERNVTAAASISRGLLEEGIMHTFSWYDRNEDEFCVMNITDFDTYEAAVLRLISSFSNEWVSESLRRYSFANIGTEFSNIIYVAKSVDEMVLAGVESNQNVQIVRNEE